MKALQGILYGGAPFFSYPWKPIIGAVYGSSYDVAYKHFRRDHSNPVNLGVHCGCLVWQLASNFALLDCIDEWVASVVRRHFPGKKYEVEATLPERLVAKATVVIWAASLVMARKCPAVVKAASLSCLAMAYLHAAKLRPHWQKMITAQSVVEVFGVKLLRPSLKIGPVPLAIAVRLGLQHLVTTKAQGILQPSSPAINTVVALVMARLSAQADPTTGKVTPFHMGLVGWLLAILTNQPALYFYSCGFIASLAQGVSHGYTKEMATLVQLQSEGFQKFAHEWAHTIFFPSLLIQSVLQSLLSVTYR